jgi:hypothetical protein
MVDIASKTQSVMYVAFVGPPPLICPRQRTSAAPSCNAQGVTLGCNAAPKMRIFDIKCTRIPTRIEVLFFIRLSVRSAMPRDSRTVNVEFFQEAGMNSQQILAPSAMLAVSVNRL